MPSNKNASYRYRLIDECLSNRAKQWTMNTLIQYINQKLYEEFDVENGISQRTLEEDFRIMRKDRPQGYAAPIKRRKGKVFYDDPAYSMRQSPLIEQDVVVLKEALGLLQQFTELPHFEELQDVVRKLENRLSEHPMSDRPILQYERNQHLKGIDWIRPLYRAIAQQQSIRLTYRPFHESESLVLIVHPHLLKEYNNRWFLLALKEDGQVMWNFALDRIIAFQNSLVPYVLSSTFDANTYFQHIIGVTIPENARVENIRLRVHPNRAPYLLTKPLHASQKQELGLDKKAIILTLELIPNFELKAMLLSFGSDVEVLSPDSLRLEIGEMTRKASEFYQEI